MDETLRELERLAKAGNLDARKRLRDAKIRSGEYSERAAYLFKFIRLNEQLFATDDELQIKESTALNKLRQLNKEYEGKGGTLRNRMLGHHLVPDTGYPPQELGY